MCSYRFGASYFSVYIVENFDKNDFWRLFFDIFGIIVAVSDCNAHGKEYNRTKEDFEAYQREELESKGRDYKDFSVKPVTSHE